MASSVSLRQEQHQPTQKNKKSKRKSYETESKDKPKKQIKQLICKKRKQNPYLRGFLRGLGHFTKEQDYRLQRRERRETTKP